MAEADSELVALQHLSSDEKAKRANTFGAVATDYQRFRPPPPPESVDWVLPDRVDRVIDLGAGTGALTRILLPRADHVTAIEPDDRMRAVLESDLPLVEAVAGKGEAMPLPDNYADAILASASWHWMDALATLHEARRVLRPGSVLAALWSGPDPDGAFVQQIRAVLAARNEASGGVGGLLGDSLRPGPELEIPKGLGFSQPESNMFRWPIALNADELIGLMGTFSWVINMEENDRNALFDEARRLLREFLGLEGDVTIDIDFRCDTFRSYLEG